MVMEESAALARLELLSNTAMMKKVLDRAGRLTDGTQPTNATALRGPDVGRRLEVRKEDGKEQHTHLAVYQQQTGGSSSSSQHEGHPPVLTERPMRSLAQSLLLRSYDRYAPGGSGCSADDSSPYRRPSESFAHPGAWIPAHGYPHPAVGNDAYFFDPTLAAASGPAAAAASAVRYRTKENLNPIQMNAHPTQVNAPAGQYMVAGRNTTAMSENAQCAIFAPQPQHRTVTSEEVDHPPVGDIRPSYEALANENIEMRRQLREKEAATIQLQDRIASLEKQISELRQLPTGKISHIPIDDMIRIMQEYGSEVSNQTLPKRKDSIKKASIVRQFRRWNPEFFRYFIHVNGEWVPKLGKEGELKRRAEKRLMLKHSQEEKL